jgi:hypothetical protein
MGDRERYCSVVDGWWTSVAFGGLFFIGGFVQARFPAKSLAYLDSRGIPVHGVPRTVGGIRAMGIVFATVGGCIVILGMLDLFGVFNRTL